MWYAGKAAFRSGFVDGTQWDKNNIGFYSFASGYITNANNLYSTALGRNTLASGTSSTSLGYFTIAGGSNSTALGAYSQAAGNDAMAMNSSTIASGFASTAMGFATMAKGDGSVAMGNYTKSLSANSLVIGSFNDTTSNNRLFEVGNGSGDNTRKNAVTILQNGHTGIGTVNPIARLHVTDSNVLFTGPAILPITTIFNPPASGAGSRMMWYPQKAAFRVGYVDGSQWDKDNIGIYSHASGFSTTASDFASTSMGVGTIASDYASTSMGYFTTASRVASTSMGYGTTASRFSSTSMGVFTTASGYASTSMGDNTIAKSDNSLVIGTYNDTTNTNRLFEIGNGTSLNLRSNAMTVLTNGNVGIGASSPNAALQFANIAATRKIVLYEAANNDHQFSGFGLEPAFIRYQLASPAGYHIFFAGTSPTNSNELFRISGNGNATLAGVLTQNSDARLKANIRPIHSPLEQLQNINGYTYNWLDKNRDTSMQVGVLAQEVQQIYPQLVHQNEKGELSVNYMGLVPVLIEAIKEQNKKLEDLQKQMEEQRKMIEQLLKK
jgi:hypothetical protein